MADSQPEKDDVDREEDALDMEIEDLEAEIESLKAQRAVHTSNILASRSSQAMLSRLRPDAPRSGNTLLERATGGFKEQDSENPLVQSLRAVSARQLVHNQECLYRTCAGITTFKVNDPDPNAVDGGSVLGLRIEAFGNGKYVRPYYIFLNRPYSDRSILRVHRHTVPPCIALPTLAARYLPTPASTRTEDVAKARKQDLLQFARSLRKEIAHYHNRLRCIAGMRKKLGLEDRRSRGKNRDLGIVDISATDAEAMQIRLEWDDGRVGRVVFDRAGKVQKTVILGEEGRDRELERIILGGDQRLETLADRIIESA